MTQSLRRSWLPLVLALSSLAADGAAAGSLQGKRFPQPNQAVDRGRAPRRRRLLGSRRPAPGLPERTRAGQPVLSDLPDGHGDGRRLPRLARHRQDDLLVHQSRRPATCCLPRRITIRRSKQQQDEELKFRASGQERRYSWDYDPEMELYVRSAKTGTLRRLTNMRGYDAEASYSPDGQWIVFSSTRSGYERAAVRGGAEAARYRSELLRRDLHHARGCRWLRRAPSHQRARLRRRPVLLTRRQAHHLAALR